MQRCSDEGCICPPRNHRVGKGWVCYRQEARGRPEEVDDSDTKWGKNDALPTSQNIYLHDLGYSSAQTLDLCPGFGRSTETDKEYERRNGLAAEGLYGGF